MDKKKNGDFIVIIPAYNPTVKLLKLVNELRLIGAEAIICVNDGSLKGENIFEILAGLPDVIVLTHAVNWGKGRSLKTAFNYVLNYYAYITSVVTVDADGQHTTEAVQSVVKKYVGGAEKLF